MKEIRAVQIFGSDLLTAEHAEIYGLQGDETGPVEVLHRDSMPAAALYEELPGKQDWR